MKRRVVETLTQAARKSAQKSAAKREAQALVSIPKTSEELQASDLELPVVARLVVEIRSDGSRTVARGAMKDELGGEQVSVIARGNSPLELAAQLTKSLLTLPASASQFAKALRDARRTPTRGDDDE